MTSLQIPRVVPGLTFSVLHICVRVCLATVIPRKKRVEKFAGLSIIAPHNVPIISVIYIALRLNKTIIEQYCEGGFCLSELNLGKFVSRSFLLRLV